VIALDEFAGLDILRLGMLADEARRSMPGGGVVTYLRVHVLRATDLVGHAEIPTAAAELRLYETPASLADAVAQVQRLRQLAGERPVVAFSMADLEERSRAGWGPTDPALTALVSAGLSDLAEIPVDRLENLSQTLRVLFAAGITARRLTVSRPIGEARLALLEPLRNVLRGHSSPVRFNPLARLAPADKPTTGYDDVRLVAMSRLALKDVTTTPISIEVDWSLYGPKLAQVALTFGADHLDAVPAISDPQLGTRRATVADVERNIRAAGFEPQESRTR
jgi:aminodeoxyfutalosine synthase